MVIHKEKISKKIIFIVIVSGLILNFAGAFYTRVLNQKEMEARFRSDAAAWSGYIKETVTTHLTIVSDIQSFYHASEKVSRHEFKTFVQKNLKKYKSIQALEWVPKVSHLDRHAYEHQAVKDGFINFRITERKQQGAMIPAFHREFYYPVYYVEPLVGNEAALGYDLSSNLRRKTALEKSCETATQVATSKIILVQEKEKQNGFLVFAPVYEKNKDLSTVENRRKYLTGFALGVFRIGDLVKHSLGLFENRLTDFDLYLTDISESTNPEELLFFSASGNDPKNFNALMGDRMVFQDRINIGSRYWAVTIVPTRTYRTGGMNIFPFLVIFIALIISFLLVKYFLASFRQIEHEQQFRNMSEKYLEGIYQCGADGTIRYINRAFANLFELSKEEIYAVGNDWSQFLPKSSWSEMNNYFKQLRSGKVVSGELRFKRKEGKAFLSYFTGVPYMNNGNIEFISGMVSDISEKRKTEEELKQRLNELEEFHRLTVGREIKMIEMKKEINEMKTKLENQKYE